MAAAAGKARTTSLSIFMEAFGLEVDPRERLKLTRRMAAAAGEKESTSLSSSWKCMVLK